MAKSLLHMISNDIGQLACLYARLHCLDRVYFGGFFIRGHPVTMRTITYSINFFSKVTGSAAFPALPTLSPASPLSCLKLAGLRGGGSEAGLETECPKPWPPAPSHPLALGVLCLGHRGRLSLACC